MLCRNEITPSFVALIALLLLALESSHGFLVLPSSSSLSSASIFAPRETSMILYMQDEYFNEDLEENNNNKTDVITKDMFLRKMLEDPNVMVKKKKGGKSNTGGFKEYKPFDNRDSMPFAVKLTTPDPYTHPDIKRKNAQKSKKKPNAVEEQIASRVYASSSNKKNNKKDLDDAAMTLLGEYALDKHTTTGDLLLIGDTEYKVVKHRCQYKYAGGQKFIMVRKILEVKEVGRLQTEEYLKRQFKQS